MQSSDKAERKDPYDLSFFKILIVEDSQFVASLMSSALRAMGVGKVLVAKDIAEVKRTLLTLNAVQSSQNVDVLIADWLLPDGDGAELVGWIRSHKSDALKFLPVIVCSSYATSEVIESARDCGANESMVKPISAQKLANRILYVIDRPRPYIQAPGYVGPERRRKMERFPGDDRRVTKAEDIEEDHEQFE